MGRIKAVRKYENPIQFPESHKLWLDCNHKPLVRGSDNAIWNRLHLIPFNVVIPAEEIDRELPAKLRAEAEGIIAWAVAGAVRWHSEELGRPDPVERAGREWRDESDHVRRFIDEACVVGEILSSGATSLYVVYSRWCEESGERALNKIDFGNALEDRGFVRTHSRTGSKYGGIAPRIGNAGGRDGSVTDRDEAL
jgi:putative DNA primase/helicase